jgi:hypothetical protein
MAQPHKGSRVQVNVYLPAVVATLIGADVATLEASSTSQYLADLLCHLYGRPELARELGRHQATLDLPLPRSPELRRASDHATDSDERVLVKMRIPTDVVVMIDEDAADKGVASRAGLLADLTCQVYGRPDLARELETRKEQLQLAITDRHEPAA